MERKKRASLTLAYSTTCVDCPAVGTYIRICCRHQCHLVRKNMIYAICCIYYIRGHLFFLFAKLSIYTTYNLIINEVQGNYMYSFFFWVSSQLRSRSRTTSICDFEAFKSCLKKHRNGCIVICKIASCVVNHNFHLFVSLKLSKGTCKWLHRNLDIVW